MSEDRPVVVETVKVRVIVVKKVPLSNVNALTEAIESLKVNRKAERKSSVYGDKTH